MASSEDRQARALEGILGQLTFLNQHLRKLAEVKDLPGIVTDTWSALKTGDGRQVGWLFPGESAVTIEMRSPGASQESIVPAAKELSPRDVFQEVDKLFRNAYAGEAKIKEDTIKSLGAFIQVEEVWSTFTVERPHTNGFRGIGHDTNAHGERITQPVRGTFHPSDPHAELQIAIANNRPGVGEFLKNATQPFNLNVFNVRGNEKGEVEFSAYGNDEVNPTKRIDGVIKDVY
jgi:hypothetical protein